MIMDVGGKITTKLTHKRDKCVARFWSDVGPEVKNFIRRYYINEAWLWVSTPYPPVSEVKNISK